MFLPPYVPLDLCSLPLSVRSTKSLEVAVLSALRPSSRARSAIRSRASVSLRRRFPWQTEVSRRASLRLRFQSPLLERPANVQVVGAGFHDKRLDDVSI